VFCVDPLDIIMVGASTVLISSLPAARMGDSCAHGGTIVSGCATVLIGDSGGDACSPQTATMSALQDGAKAFTQKNFAAKGAHSEQVDSPLFSEGDPKKRAWIEVALVDESGDAVPYARYRVVAPDGTVREGFLDDKGLARVGGIDPGTCHISFPKLDSDAWAPV
jgi:hypothetical protein